MTSRMLLRSTRPAAGFLSGRQAAAAQRSFTTSQASLSYKESSSK